MTRESFLAFLILFLAIVRARDVLFEDSESDWVEPMMCRLKVAKHAPCFGHNAAIVEALVSGGTPPYKYHWTGLGQPVRNVLFSGHGGAWISVTAIDSHGDTCTRKIQLGPRTPLKGHIEVEKHVLCPGGHGGVLNLTATGGYPPLSYLWSGGGSTHEDVAASAGNYSVTVTDAEGCAFTTHAVVLEPPPISVAVLSMPKVTMIPLGAVVELSVSGGTPSYAFSVSRGHVGHTHRGENSTRFVLTLLGVYGESWATIQITDSMACAVHTLNVTFPKLESPVCPKISSCLTKRILSPSTYIFCLRKAAAPLIWAPRTSWSCCRASALVAIVAHLQQTAQNTDQAAAYFSVVLGLAIDAAPEKERCGYAVATSVQPFWRRHNKLINGAFLKHGTRGLYLRFQEIAMRIILFRSTSPRVDTRTSTVMTVGPYGFDNEPVFAPALTLPSNKTRVVALVLKEYFFPSSSVTMAEFPWTLQIDVELAAVFVRDAMRLVQPKWVFSADSAGVLVIGKVAASLAGDYYDSERDATVFAALQRSSPWPPVYPPIHLSKLFPGHEEFSPKEVILTESDGLHLVSPDLARARKALETVGDRAYLKREYSEASRGVAQVYQKMLSKAFDVVFPRAIGISHMDLDLKVRIFMQQAVTLPPGARPLGFRFLALAGKVMAAHLSGGVEQNMVYRTERNAAIEEASVRVIQVSNYSGIGAIWWWRDSSEKPFLIDFNPRLERHACLNAVLSTEADLKCDPCHVLQEDLVSDLEYVSQAPHILRGGIEYLDPVRAMGGSHFQIERLLLDNKHIPWNMHASDTALMELVRKKVAQAAK